MADIPSNITPLPPPVADAAAQPQSHLAAEMATPPLVATTHPSPALEALVSPSLGPADKDAFVLDPPQAAPKWAMPECWGHRGASASFPENTRMSFVEACKAGADGIETDIHITADDQLVLFHDPELSRTTDGKGRLHDQPWHGVLEHVRTLEAPHQPIPKFSEVIELLMQPEHMHVKLNIDCKVENNPEKLFTLIRAELATVSGWETLLAPRIVLGLWHPKFLQPAAALLPAVTRYCISMDLREVRKYFWDLCHGFSVWFPQLASAEGARFRAAAAAAGKGLCTWTVNEREDMLECARWGVTAIITDKPALWRELRAGIAADRERALRPTLQSYLRPYLTLQSWWFERERQAREETAYLEREGGAFAGVVLPVPVVTDGMDAKAAPPTVALASK